MSTFAFYDTKPYDRVWFDRLKDQYQVQFKYIQDNLCAETAYMAEGCDGAVAFINDVIDQDTISILSKNQNKLLALRCSGYNNVDLQAAKGKLTVVRVPAYSPYSVAEYAAALLLALNRKIHRAYLRTRDFDFSIEGLTGFDLHGKTVGVIGTGKIGQAFIQICKGIGMKVLAYDPYPQHDLGIDYLERLDDLFPQVDILSLHCPLTQDTYHIIRKETIDLMRRGVMIINTSRGALIKSEDLLDAIKVHKVGGAGLDVYEEETDLFYENFSDEIIQDDIIARLLSMPNVIITSHQAFLTDEALHNIARITLESIRRFTEHQPLEYEVSV